MRIGIIVTTHQGELRPNGQELINNFINSCKHINHEYKIYLFDNSSETPIQTEDSNVVLTYVEDQTIRGLTGTWNDGVIMACNDDCDVILVSNDDVTINETINKLIDSIDGNYTIYGPTSNGIIQGLQKANGPKPGRYDLTNNKSNMLNGFFFGFTKKFVYNFINENKLFNEDYPWGGNEEEFQRRIWKNGASSIVIRDCWLSHVKIRGWKKLHYK
jgi:hypothetical protein